MKWLEQNRRPPLGGPATENRARRGVCGMWKLDRTAILRALDRASRPVVRLFLRWARHPAEPGMPACWRPRGRVALRWLRWVSGQRPTAAWAAPTPPGPARGDPLFGSSTLLGRFVLHDAPARLRLTPAVGLRFRVEVVRPRGDGAPLTLVARTSRTERILHAVGVSELAVRGGGAPIAAFDVAFRHDEIDPADEVFVQVAGEAAPLCRGCFTASDFAVQRAADFVERGTLAPGSSLTDPAEVAAFLMQAVADLRAAYAAKESSGADREAVVRLQLGLIDRAVEQAEAAPLEVLVKAIALDACVFHHPVETLRRVLALDARDVAALGPAVWLGAGESLVLRSRTATAYFLAVRAVTERRVRAPTATLLDLRRGLETLNFGQDALMGFFLAAQRALPQADAEAFRAWAVRGLVARHRPALR